MVSIVPIRTIPVSQLGILGGISWTAFGGGAVGGRDCSAETVGGTGSGSRWAESGILFPELDLFVFVEEVFLTPIVAKLIAFG